MSIRKALCVGINVFKNYPGSTLHGCVNDANQMVGVLEKYLGFKAADIKVLTDAQATKQAIMTELTAMVNGAKTGKYAYLVFSLSSHGTQVPDKNGDEQDHYDEAFCPYDLAAKSGQWDPKHVLVDDELHDLFAQVPDNVLVEVYLDTCHSGTGLKAVDLMPDRRPRYIAPPSMEACEKVVALMPRGIRRRMTEKAAKNVILWAACRDNQTSADAYIGGAYHGAFTYYWVKEITAANNKISRSDLLKKVNADLKGNHYSQVAQLECPATQRKIAPE
ncbi:MAG: peptidase C14 [Geobacter sp.]|nr:MAG: peptidase C14 [Geobacter sp.]